MAPPRRKAPKQEAPQTLEAAIALIAEYRDLNDTIEQLAADAGSAIARIEAERDRMAKPLEVRASAIFLQLRAWWAVAAPELTQNKRKSVPLAGCLIGERTSPPALKLRKTTMAKLVEKLVALKKAAVIRTTHKLDKPTAIKAIQAEDELGRMLGELGAYVAQGEEFFVDWPRPKPADTATTPETDE
ncbi:host-nuclease inhibitor Gam family protein [Novosphingobium sp. EMRT-2]|uniref:host-nuclease inhibitor Gam family protein n=1 Tax=Novosphingobium sp. EMRT-2 TaxID=2571749 RepID=UPI00143D4808|nr:host-nuclease inhibitor Gam family protein [Novosphingobium sp. EMRT-2]